MLDFSQNAVFNLKKINPKHMNRNAQMILVEDEEVLGVYRTVRDQVIFTNMRIITVDIQGVTGMRQELFILPYSNVQYFAIQTVGFAEIIPDAELTLFFSNGKRADFEFAGDNDILEIGRLISQFTLMK